MKTIVLDEYEWINMAGHSSKGNQLKWKNGNEWYKADYMGYEGLAEILISRLLRKSNINDFVMYEPVELEYKGKKYIGCKSTEFLHENEEVVTLQKLFRQYTGKNLVQEIAKFPEVRDKILYVVENVKRFTGLQDFGKYLSVAMTIDTFFLNEDRHTNNIAVIYNTEKDKYRLCPYFDHGLSLFSDTTVDFKLEETLENCYEKIEAKPFNRKFDDQLDEVELIYGAHVKFYFGMNDILKELDTMKNIYTETIIDRVEKILRLQMRKYQYLFSE